MNKETTKKFKILFDFDINKYGLENYQGVLRHIKAGEVHPNRWMYLSPISFNEYYQWANSGKGKKHFDSWWSVKNDHFVNNSITDDDWLQSYKEYQTTGVSEDFYYDDEEED